MSYVVPDELYGDALRAVDWYETTGMKVAKPPGIPHVVARWIVLHCKATATTDQREGGGE